MYADLHQEIFLVFWKFGMLGSDQLLKKSLRVPLQFRTIQDADPSLLGGFEITELWTNL